MRPRPFLLAAAAALVLAAGAAQASSVLDAAVAEAGWQQVTPPGKRAANFALDAEGAVRVRAEDAVSFLYRPIAASAGEAMKLSWRWRVDQAPPASAQGPGSSLSTSQTQSGHSTVSMSIKRPTSGAGR